MEHPISLHSSSKQIEDYLHDRIKTLNWLGEFDLSREQFGVIGHVVRALSNTNDGITLKRIPPLIFMISLVFTARYAEFTDEEAPAFWRPYARMVWGLEEADQTFQAQCRGKFRAVRALLEDKYGLYFPHKINTYDQDVVGGIYIHAILPSYLEDDFAQWIASLWKRQETWARSADLPLDVVVSHMRYHPTLEYVRRRLRYFIERDDTCETAARLVQTMAAAADEHDRGASFEQVASMLSFVERAIWSELRAALVDDDHARRHRERFRNSTTGTRLMFAWDTDQNALAVQVRNWRVSSATPPDRLVWAESAVSLQEYRRYVAVKPWKHGAEWEIDAVYLSQIEPMGVLALVDEADRVLGEPLPLPALPVADVLLFRLDEEESYALLTETNRVGDGVYLISSVANTQVIDARTDTALSPEFLLEPLDALHARGHRDAGRYTVTLPLKVSTPRDELHLRRRRGNLQAELVGERIAGLAPEALPVFTTAPRLRVLNAAALFDDLVQLRLRLTSEHGHSIDLQLDHAVMHAVDDDYWIELAPLTAQQGGVFALTLLQNIARVLPEPLRFGVLPPGVAIKPPTNGYYTEQATPRAVLMGVKPEDVYTEEGAVSTVWPSVIVDWHNPLAPTRLQLLWQGWRIPLEWRIAWAHAWIDPPTATASIDDLEGLTLHLMGRPRTSFTLQVGDGVPRTYPPLNARGVYASVIAHDPLKDMLRDYPSGRVPITATDGQTRWQLFTFVRAAGLESDQLPSLVQIAIHAAKHLAIRNSQNPERAQVKPAALVALPLEKVTNLALPSTNPLAPVMRAILSVKDVPTASLTPWGMPSTYPLALHFDQSPECLQVEVKSLDATSGVTVFTLPETTPDGTSIETRVELNLEWQTDTDTGQTLVNLFSADPKLRLCGLCRCFFLDSPSAKIFHSHSKGWGVKHRSVQEQPFLSTLSIDYPAILARWRPNFATVLDRTVTRSYRIRKDKAARCVSAPFYTVDGYRYAVAEWSLNLNTPEREKKLHQLTNSAWTAEIAQFRQDYIVERAALQSPALYALSYLLELLEPDQGDPWSSLDLCVFGAALICRAQAHGHLPTVPLLARLPDEHMLDLLSSAIVGCPALLTWAVSWVELYLQTFTAVISPSEDNA